MENEIRRGTYVTLDYYGCSSEVPITQALYSRHYGKIGLVRLVKYVGGASRQVAEVIFSGVPYIAEVPIDLLLSIGACKSGSIPEPGMYFQTCIGEWKCAKYINFVRNTQTGVCYRIATDDTTYYGHFKEETFTYGAPRIIRFFDSPKTSQVMPTPLDVKSSIYKEMDEIINNFKKNNHFKYEKEKVMENEIRHGDYVELTDTLDGPRPTIISKLYDQHRGRIGLVRAVKYVPGYAGKIAEVIFSGVPYNSEVPVKYLNRIGKRLGYPDKNPKYPEPRMKVTSFSTGHLPALVHDVVFKKEDDGFVEYYSIDGEYNKLKPYDDITLGYPEIKPFYDCGYAPKYVYHDYIDTDIASTYALENLIRSSQYFLKGETTMKNTNKKYTPSNPIKQVIFNGPATIVYWKDGSKTVVKCQEGAVNDPEKGFAMAVARHYFCDILGMSRYDGIFKKYLPKETKEK